MPYKTNRASPQCYVVAPRDTSLVCQKLNRIVILATGRGDSNITPEEARELAKSLTASAEKAEKILAEIAKKVNSAQPKPPRARQ